MFRISFASEAVKALADRNWALPGQEHPWDLYEPRICIPHHGGCSIQLSLRIGRLST
jgi:hypothetical protein